MAAAAGHTAFAEVSGKRDAVRVVPERRVCGLIVRQRSREGGLRIQNGALGPLTQRAIMNCLAGRS